MDSLAFAIAYRTYLIRQYRILWCIEREITMDRLAEKLARAGGVVARQTAKIEARADSLIAREDAIEARTEAVFNPHESILASAEKGLDGLEDKLRLLSNAPLPVSGGSSEDNLALTSIPRLAQPEPIVAQAKPLNPLDLQYPNQPPPAVNVANPVMNHTPMARTVPSRRDL